MLQRRRLPPCPLVIALVPFGHCLGALEMLQRLRDDSFCVCFQEAGLDMLDSAKEPFLEINQILEALKQKDLQPALM